MTRLIALATVSLALGLATGCELESIQNGDPEPGTDFLPPSARITDGQQLLYTFADGAGTTVSDVSGVGQPVNLVIGDITGVAWQAGGGLDVRSPTILKAAVLPEKVQAACGAGNAISIEVWHQPASVTQEDARLITYSENNNQRNFSLIQGQVRYEARLRTTGTDDNGSPALRSDTGTVTGQVSHVVFTRDPISSRLFVDGQVVETDVLDGDFSNWNAEFELAIGNELNEERPYRGTLFLAAVYCRALEPAEVQVNFDAGF